MPSIDEERVSAQNEAFDPQTLFVPALNVRCSFAGCWRGVNTNSVPLLTNEYEAVEERSHRHNTATFR